MTDEKNLDPIEFEIFKNIFVSVAEEMGVTLCRTGFSPNIKERLDYSCAIYDASGHTIAQGDHLPVHLGAMPLSVRAAIESGPLHPGDTIILNDPFRGGTHLPDITLVSPVFLPSSDSKPAFFVANRAHHSDVGGMSPGSMPLAREIFQEGLIVPPVKLVKHGTLDSDLLALILANVRTPLEREGDLTAQIAANRVGELRLLALAQNYGLEKIYRYAAATQDYAERMLRSTIAAIPDGRYEFADALDNDGFSDAPVRIRNVHIFDPSTGTTGPLSTIVVMRDRIALILPGDGGAPPADETIIDGQGGTIIPGLHDMHSHTTIASGLFNLAAGVTATRDMGNVNVFLQDLLPRLDTGEIAGPRIVPDGFIEGRSPFSARFGFVISTLDEGMKAVHWYADRGYFEIKLYNSMNPDFVKPLAA